MIAGQGDLFGVVDRPLRPARLMWVYDRQVQPGDGFVARFCCARCGHRTEWLECFSEAHAEFGIPCPVCSFSELVTWLGGARRCF